MFMALFIVLLVAWLLGWVAFHVAGGMIHLLLIVAIISLISSMLSVSGSFLPILGDYSISVGSTVTRFSRNKYL